MGQEVSAGRRTAYSQRAALLSAFSLFVALAYAGKPAAAQVGGAAPSGVERGDEHQVILITGSTDGMGRELARRLAATGAHIIVHGRNRERGAEVVREIEESGLGSARFYPADLGSLEQVRELAATIERDYDRLDVLINNAGVLISGGERQTSADGHELHFAVNYLSGFLLTHLLLPMIVESAPARIVNIASVAQSPIDFNDVMLETGNSAGRGYGQSKLALIMFSFDLATQLEGTGVVVNALHPATLMDTQMVRDMGRPPMATVDEGADAVMNLVTSADIGTGQYFNGLQPARANAQAYDEEARERLRLLSRELTGLE